MPRDVEGIGDVVQVLGGGTPSTSVAEYWEGGDVVWYSPSDLTAAGAMFMFRSSKNITPLGLEKSSAHLFPANCVMMTSRATIGVVAINKSAACTNQGFITCVPGVASSAGRTLSGRPLHVRVTRLRCPANFPEHRESPTARPPRFGSRSGECPGRKRRG